MTEPGQVTNSLGNTDANNPSNPGAAASPQRPQIPTNHGVVSGLTEHDLLVDLLNADLETRRPYMSTSTATTGSFQGAPARLELNTVVDSSTSGGGDRRLHPATSSVSEQAIAETPLSIGGSSYGLPGQTVLRNRPDPGAMTTSEGSNPFADPYRPSETGGPSESTTAKTHPGASHQYDDFETIGWLKEIARDRNRHRDIKNAKRRSRVGWLLAFWDSGSGWICALLIGIITGLFAGNIDIGCSWLSDLKEGVCAEAFWLNREQCCWSALSTNNNTLGFEDLDCDQWKTWPRLLINKNPGAKHPDAYFVAYLIYVLWALLLSFLCVMLVRVFAPYACGSGIPEIKTILSGFVIRGYLGKWTLIIKSVGMMLAVSAGLSLGKEGPMVHVASCCGNVLAYLFPKYGKNEAKKREILSASAAAGVAVAFGAPIGGVLFSLEEASYYFPLKTMFRSFFCAMISANVLRMMNPFGTDHLVMFYVDYNAQWHALELIGFAILGALGGVFGALFIRANLMICRLRKTTWLGNHPIREVILVTLVTAVISYPHSFLRINSSQLIRNLVSQCGPGDTMPLCDYIVNMSDPTSLSFGSFPAGPGVYYSLWMLAIALIVKMLTTVFTFGMKVPAGLFIPSMTVGAIMGRMMGIGVEQLAVSHRDSWPFRGFCKSSQPCINPGLYAMVGAAACLGGVTRMTISLVVIMLELTGGLNYIIPLMVAAMMSKWTGDRITSGGIYDEHIKLNDYPYLSSEDELPHTANAADVMKPKAEDPPLQVIPQDSLTVTELSILLLSSEYTGFPIVTSAESRYLVGFVTRKDLNWALERSQQNPGSGVGGTSTVYFTEHLPSFGEAPSTSAPQPLHLRDILDLAPITVTDQTPMETVMDFFRKLGLRQLLVTRNGRLLGIITKKDVLRHIHELRIRDSHLVSFP